jgi:hypothetical protein
MIRRIVMLFALAIVATSPAFAVKVYVDFDKDVDFGTYRTFAFDSDHERTLMNYSPLMHERVLELIRQRLLDAGLEETAENPDLYVTYQVSVREEMQLETVNMGYSYGPGWGYHPYYAWHGSMGTSSTRAYKYEVGTLLLDIWQADGEKLVWRASAEDTVSKNPEKGIKKVEKALHKMGKIFRKEYRKVEKARAKGAN